MISICINVGLFMIIGLTINANFWYWLLLVLYLVVKIFEHVCDILEEKCQKDITNKVINFNNEILNSNKKIIKADESVLLHAKRMIDICEQFIKERNKNE